MPDRSFLDWPFFTDAHRRLAADLDAACRALVAKLGAGWWLRYCVPAP